MILDRTSNWRESSIETKGLVLLTRDDEWDGFRRRVDELELEERRGEEEEEGKDGGEVVNGGMRMIRVVEERENAIDGSSPRRLSLTSEYAEKKSRQLLVFVREATRVIILLLCPKR